MTDIEYGCKFPLIWLFPIRSASLPTTTHPIGVEGKHKQTFSDTESMDSFIDKINSELGDKSSLEDSTSDDESYSDEEQPAQQSSDIRR